MHRPSMGLLRRPTTSKIVEDGRFSRPCGPGAHSRASEKTSLRLRYHFQIDPQRVSLTAKGSSKGTYLSAMPGREHRSGREIGDGTCTLASHEACSLDRPAGHPDDPMESF